MFLFTKPMRTSDKQSVKIDSILFTTLYPFSYTPSYNELTGTRNTSWVIVA